jgi:hypothetical protein
MIIGVTHDQDGRVVQRLSVSTKVSFSSLLVSPFSSGAARELANRPWCVSSPTP